MFVLKRFTISKYCSQSAAVGFFEIASLSFWKDVYISSKNLLLKTDESQFYQKQASRTNQQVRLFIHYKQYTV